MLLLCVGKKNRDPEYGATTPPQTTTIMCPINVKSQLMVDLIVLCSRAARTKPSSSSREATTMYIAVVKMLSDDTPTR